jgi:hypothetical protein
MKKSNIIEVLRMAEEAKNPPEMVEVVCGEAQYHWRAGNLQPGETYKIRKDDCDQILRDSPKVIRKVVTVPEDKMVKGSPERK